MTMTRRIHWLSSWNTLILRIQWIWWPTLFPSLHWLLGSSESFTFAIAYMLCKLTLLLVLSCSLSLFFSLSLSIYSVLLNWMNTQATTNPFKSRELWLEEEEMKRRKREKSERFQASLMEGGHVQGTEWEARNSPELIASERLGPQSYKHKELDSASNLNYFASWFYPRVFL